MNIVVCVKPVRTELVFQNEQSSEAFVMNPYDLFALEKCIELKKKQELKITCICMGAKGAESLLRKAIAMGVDEAVLVNDKAFAGSDTVATSYIMAKAIQKIGDVDLIVCGEKTIDGETGQVAYGIAERLNIHTISKVDELLDVTDEKITLIRKSETLCSKLRVALPVLAITSDFRLYHPKVSLLGLKKAKRKEILCWGIDELKADDSKCGLTGSRTKVENIKSDLIKKEFVVLEGSATDIANKMLSAILRSEYRYE